MSSIPEALAAGLEHHRAGRLQQAELMYRQVLQMQPRHAGAAHLLSLIAFQAGKLEFAEKLLESAIQVDPFRATYLADLAEIYAARGKAAEAIASFRKAISLNPESAEYHNSLGRLLRDNGQADEAVLLFRDAVNLDPRHSQAAANLAAVLHSLGKLDEARAMYEIAARNAPQDANVYLGFGRCLRSLDDLRGAVSCFQMAARLSPEWPLAHFHLARAQQLRGELDQASAGFLEAIRLQPDFARAHCQLGAVLRDEGNRTEAIARFEEALRHDPRLTEARLCLANCLLSLDRRDEAEAVSRLAVELDPGSHRAIDHLASALQMQGDADGALAELRRAHEIDPDDHYTHCKLIHAMNFVADCDAQEVFDAHRAWALRHADPLTSVAAPHRNDRSADRRLRIGYVSGHFYHHAVSYFSLPLLAAHDHEQLEVFCYANSTQSDPVTSRFQQTADAWRVVDKLTDDALAAKIREDKIDILVDLSGHILGNRLLAFARKPAPVQVTYLGYQNTTGMTAMDYRLTDEHSDPAGQTDAYYTEKLLRLPDSFFCFAPLQTAPEPNELPALSAEFVTLGWFNNVLKTNRESIAMWRRLLAEVPNTRLLVLAHQGGALESRIRCELATAGIDGSRLEVVNLCSPEDYLRLHHRVDLALDSFPFNGHTTVCNALWMGVPSVVRQGDRYASRFGGSALASLGLNELIATSDEQYVQIVAGLANDLPRLAGWRRTLRARMSESVLMDAPRFARGVEGAYRQMWQQWCRSA